jgi:hypothetical protein
MEFVTALVGVGWIGAVSEGEDAGEPQLLNKRIMIPKTTETINTLLI